MTVLHYTLKFIPQKRHPGYTTGEEEG